LEETVEREVQEEKAATARTVQIISVDLEEPEARAVLVQ
jgi:hypothetical protein